MILAGLDHWQWKGTVSQAEEEDLPLALVAHII